MCWPKVRVGTVAGWRGCGCVVLHCKCRRGEPHADMLHQARMRPMPRPRALRCLLSHLAGAKQAEELLGGDALELVALYDQLCVVRFLHERMPEAAEAGEWGGGG